MNKGLFSISKVFNGISFVTKVEIEVNFSNTTSEDIILFDQDCWSSIQETEHFKASARFGIFYALSEIPREFAGKKFNILFKLIKGFIIDTTPIILAFGASMAFFNALGLDADKKFFFDEEKLLFCFIK